MLYAFDTVARDLDPAVRKRFIEGFLLPAGIQCRNHYIGDGNQQATANMVTLYAGLAARNWPLVSFAYSSDHGIESIIEWTFDDDGVHHRKGYQTYVTRPVLWTAELLRGRGVDLYARHEDRLRAIVNADTAAKGEGRPFEDRYFWQFVTRERLPAPEPGPPAEK
jgi:hypothetical protein